MTLTPEDHWQIDQLMVKYSQSLDEGDLDAFLGCFSPDGSFEGLEPPKIHHPGSYVGGEGLTRLFREVNERAGGRSRHLVVATRAQSVGQGARAISNCIITLYDPSGPSATTVVATGIYYDELVRTNGVWRIRRRRFGRDPRQPTIDGMSHTQWLKASAGGSRPR